MREYKLNSEDNKGIPSKETIEKYKDFSRLSHEYNKLIQKPKVPLYRDKKMFLVILLIVLVAFMFSQLSEEKEEDTKQENPTNQVE